MELFKIIAIFCIFSVQLKGTGGCKALRIGPASFEGICSNPEGKALRIFRTYFRDIVIDCYFKEDGTQDFNEEMKEEMEEEMKEAMKKMMYYQSIISMIVTYH